MNKADLVEQIAERTGSTKSSIEVTLNETLAIIKKAVQSGDDVTLVGFGTFTQTNKKARQGRNPQTGEEITIPAMTLPRFRPGKDFKSMLAH